jgi:hypothetical protein
MRCTPTTTPPSEKTNNNPKPKTALGPIFRGIKTPQTPYPLFLVSFGFRLYFFAPAFLPPCPPATPWAFYFPLGALSAWRRTQGVKKGELSTALTGSQFGSDMAAEPISEPLRSDSKLLVSR